MLKQKIYSAIIGAGFLTAMSATSALAADVSISGTIQTSLFQYSSTSQTAGSDIKVSSSGGSKTYNHMYTSFDETELKFKTKGETPNGWKTSAEIEMEIGQGGKNDFELEEASASIDFGSIKLTGGILEDWGTETGAAWSYSLDEWDTKVDGSDESAAFRVGIKGIENLDLDLKLRFGSESISGVSGSDVAVGANETRIQAKYNFGMGVARFIYASRNDTAANSDDAGDYKFAETNTDMMVQLKLGKISPWIEITNSKKEETAVAVGSSKTETKDAQTIIGVDFGLNDQMTITGLLLTQEQDTGGSTKAKKTAITAGATYAVKPVTFKAVYFTTSNNASSVNSSKKDASSGGLEFSMYYKF